MLTRRLQILRPLTQSCTLRPITIRRFGLSEKIGPPSDARKRRGRFITREVRHEEPVAPPTELIEPPEESPSPGPLPLSLYEALFRKPTPSPVEDAFVNPTTPSSTSSSSSSTTTTTTTDNTITTTTGSHSYYSPSVRIPLRKNYDEDPPKINLRADDELSGWLNEALVKALRASSNPKEATNTGNPPSVLILSPLPRSLIASDFYRLAPQGTHVDGWASGLTKVIQARHPHSHEPREQYFLIFDTRSAAKAYLENIQSLHRQTLETLHPAFHPTSPPKVNKPYPWSHIINGGDQTPKDNNNNDSFSPFDETDDYHPFADEDPDTAVPLPLFPSRDRLLSYALLPPTTPLTAAIIRLDSLLAQIHHKTLNHPGLVPYGMQRHLTPNHKNPVPPDDNRVLVQLRGGRMTKDHLMDAIVFDGRQRNLEWGLEAFDDMDYEHHHHHHHHDRDYGGGEEDVMQQQQQQQQQQRQQQQDGTITSITPTTTITTARRPRRAKLKVKREWNTIHPLKITKTIVKTSLVSKVSEDGEEEEEGRKEVWDLREEEVKEGDGQEEEGGGPGMAGYSRFVVSFKNATEARRFVRAWHQRSLGDGRTDRILKVHCTQLW